jgi:hypothetical protein
VVQNEREFVERLPLKLIVAVSQALRPPDAAYPVIACLRFVRPEIITCRVTCLSPEAFHSASAAF